MKKLVSIGLFLTLLTCGIAASAQEVVNHIMDFRTNVYFKAPIYLEDYTLTKTNAQAWDNTSAWVKNNSNAVPYALQSGTSVYANIAGDITGTATGAVAAWYTYRAKGHITVSASNEFDLASPDKPIRHGYFGTGSIYLGSTPLTDDKVQAYDGYASTKANQSSVNTLSARVDNQAMMNAEMMLAIEALGEWTAHPYYSALPDYFTDQTWYDTANSTNLTFNSISGYTYVPPAAGVGIGYGQKYHWKMNDNASSTGVADSMGNQALTASRNTDVLHTNGVIDGAFNLDGSDVCSQGGFQPWIGTVPFTVAMWFNPVADVAPNDHLFSLGNWGQAGGAFQISRSDGTELTGTFDGGWTFTASTVNPLNTWSHLALTFDGVNVLTVYFNGAVVKVYTNALNALSGDMSIGSGIAAERPFAGGIDDVRIYTNCQPANIITALYNDGLGTESDLPVGSSASNDVYGKLQSLTWATPTTNNSCTVVALTDKTTLPPATNWWFDVSPDNGSTWSNISFSSGGLFSPDTNYTRWTGNTMYDVYGSQWVYRASWSNAETMKLKGTVIYVETK